MDAARTDKLATFFACIVAIVATLVFDRYGFEQRWHAAILNTVLAASGVLSFYHRRWRKTIFWQSAGLCFLGHLILMWIIFGDLLKSVKNIGTLVWTPLAVFESLVLLAFVDALQKRFESRLRMRSQGSQL